VVAHQHRYRGIQNLAYGYSSRGGRPPPAPPSCAGSFSLPEKGLFSLWHGKLKLPAQLAFTFA